MTADSSLSQAVRERYAEAARQALTTNTTSCCGGASGCGQSTAPLSIDPITSNLYDEEQTPFDGALAASLLAGCVVAPPLPPPPGRAPQGQELPPPPPPPGQ